MKKSKVMVFVLSAYLLHTTGCATTTPADQTASANPTASADPTGEPQTAEPPRLGGKGPGGGIIFYDDSIGFDFDNDGSISDEEKNLFENTSLAGRRFLEAAPAGWHAPDSREDPRAAWGGDDSNIAEIDDIRMTIIKGEAERIRSTVGKGKENTELIVAYLDEHTQDRETAAHLCNNYDGGGFSDWFLPTLGELTLLHVMKDQINGLVLDSYNASSEAQFNNLRWVVIFRKDKAEYDTIRKHKKWFVRPIRAF